MRIQRNCSAEGQLPHIAVREARLPGDEKQKLAVARVLLKDSSVVISEEASM